MNNKNKNSGDKQTNHSTINKFKKVRIKGPITIMSNMLSTFKKKNAFKSPSFWMRNIIFIFISLKLFQFYRYAKEFDVIISKEEAHSDLIYLNAKSFKNLNQQALYEYLDKLEQEKEKRKILKEKNKSVDV